MKKRLLAAALALIVLAASLGAVPAAAAIVFYDDFENGKSDFWGEIGYFSVENGVMGGYSDAVVAQSYFESTAPNSPLYTGRGTVQQYTVWVDVRIDRDKDADTFGAGLWVCDPTDVAYNGASDRDVYKLIYYAQEGTHTSFVRFTRDSPRNGMSGNVIATLDLPETPGFNIAGAPVKLGILCQQGIIVAFANGHQVGAYAYSTLGTNYTPILFWNTNCRAEFDNFYVGDISENLAVRTAPSTSTAEHTVTVTSGTSLLSRASEAKAVTIMADAAPGGQTFDKWVVDSGSAVLANEYAPVTAFSMPAEDVVVRATYKSGSASGANMDPTYLTFANTTDFNALMSSTYNECTRAIENGELKLTAQNVGSSNSMGLPDPYATIRYTKITKKIYAEDYKYLTLVYRIPEENSQSSYTTEVFFNTQNKGARAGQSASGATSTNGGKYRYLTLNASNLTEWAGVITSIRLDFFSNAANGDVMYVHNVLFSKTAAEARLQGQAVTDYLNIPEQMTLSFNMNSHGTQVPSQTLGRGQLPTRPADPTADGYVFLGWYTTRSYASLFDFDAPLRDDAIAYARWKKVYAVTFDCGEGVTAPPTQYVESGTSAVRPDDPVRDGYTFGGWFTSTAYTQEFNFSSAIRANKTIYARWDEIIDPSADAVILHAPVIYVAAGTAEVAVPITVTGCPQDGLASAVFNTRVSGASIASGEAAAAITGPDSAAVVGPTARSASSGVSFMWLSVGDGVSDGAELVTFIVALPDGADVGDRFDVVLTPSSNPEDFLATDGVTGMNAIAENGGIVVIDAPAAVIEVIAAIDAIGEVTLDSESDILEAEALYAALSDGDKALVTNYGDLTAARAAYDDLLKAHAYLSLSPTSAKIGVNLYVELPSGKTPADYTVVFGGTERSVAEGTQTVNAGRTLYRFTITATAKQMTDEFAFQIKTAAGAVEREGTVTVRGYADILSRQTSDEDVLAFLDAMLVYGAAAQRYFEYNVLDPASDTRPSGAVPASVFPKDALNAALAGTPIGYTAMNLTFRSDTVLSLAFYPRDKSDIAGAKAWMEQNVTVDGAAVSPVVSGDHLIVNVPGIPAWRLTSDIVLAVGGQTFAASPVQYMYNAVTSKPGTALAELCTAMYAYGVAAAKLN